MNPMMTPLFLPAWVLPDRRHCLAHRLGLSGREWITPCEFRPGADEPGFVTGDF
jgi:hypothetical protein